MRTKQKYSDRLDAAKRRKLRITDFGIPETREFPMPDAIHVHAAEAYFRFAPEDKKPLLAHRILIKARKFGVKIESPTIIDYAAEYNK